MEVEPEKLSSPVKAGVDFILFFIFDLTATSLPNLKTRIKLIK
jgi:hypothetical protein